MPSTAKLTFPLVFNKKNTGTPIRAADPKQSNCRFVKLNKIFDFTRVKSRGTGIYATNQLTSLSNFLMSMENAFRKRSCLEQCEA